MSPGGLHHRVRDIQQGGPKNQRHEDIRNGLLPVLGGRNAFGDGARDTDDGSKALLPGETAGSGTVHRVKGGDGAWVSGGSYAYGECERRRGETALGKHAPRWG